MRLEELVPRTPFMLNIVALEARYVKISGHILQTRDCPGWGKNWVSPTLSPGTVFSFLKIKIPKSGNTIRMAGGGSWACFDGFGDGYWGLWTVVLGSWGIRLLGGWALACFKAVARAMAVAMLPIRCC